jgi:hypothetical protein
MNLQQKIQLGLGALLILGGAATAVLIPGAGLGIAGVLIPSGIAVAGFSNTVTKAIGSALSSNSIVASGATDKIPKP